MCAIAASIVLVLATAYRMWSVLQLLHRYRVDEYGTLPAARRLLTGSTVAVVVMLGAIVTLAYCSGIWWVVAFASIVASLAVGKVAWAIHMRRSGKFVAFYKARSWS